MKKKLYFDGFVSQNPEVVEVVSNDPLDWEREKAFVKACGGSQSHRAICNEYFFVPEGFDPLGKTLSVCRAAGCCEVKG